MIPGIEVQHSICNLNPVQFILSLLTRATEVFGTRYRGAKNCVELSNISCMSIANIDLNSFRFHTRCLEMISKMLYASI